MMPVTLRDTIVSAFLLVFGVSIALLAFSSQAAGQAQEKVLYSFCTSAGCTDGSVPQGKLIFDGAGNLYGTTKTGGANCQGGEGGCGTVFELNPSSDGTWTENVIYSLGANSTDGAYPTAGLVFDRAGNLYGTTEIGGMYGQGTVFQLTPPTSQGGSWTEAVLWSFGATGDGRQPFSDLILDASRHLYGTTSVGGGYGAGTVFRLTPHTGGKWSEDILSSFGPDTANGYNPRAGVTLDKSGNLYGTTAAGGSSGLGKGVVYKLSPTSRLPWSETVLFKFTQQTGENPISTVIFDSLGNLYGTVSEPGGGAFELTPKGKERTLLFGGAPGPSVPYAGVLIQGSTLYGTTNVGGTQEQGTVFQIHGTTATVLYSFCSELNCADGSLPQAAIVARNGDLYGTAAGGGANGGWGVVYEISMPLRSTAPHRPGVHRAPR
jgi:uncharacterized repeat protein (TIGR03803 family)